jgi:NSS family neurotransmitter:Na+ symporter
LALAIFLLGIPTALSTSTLTFYNALAYKFLLPLSVLGVLLFVGWVDVRDSVAELRLGMDFGDGFAATWLWFVRVVSLVGVVVTLVFGVLQLLGFDPTAIIASII